jgi:hypothetical protein
LIFWVIIQERGGGGLYISKKYMKTLRPALRHRLRQGEQAQGINTGVVKLFDLRE